VLRQVGLGIGLEWWVGNKPDQNQKRVLLILSLKCSIILYKSKIID
jgi:hypothetical protein